MGLNGKRVLLIGGGSGIGYGVAKGAIADGAEVVVASTNAQKVEAAAKTLGAAATGVVLDATDEDQVEAFFAERGEFDHVVYTAGDWGGPRRGPLKDADLKLAPTLFNVRFWGALTVAKHAKIVAGGSLILTDGMVAQKPAKGASISSAMAGAVEHLVRSLAVEMAPVRVNGVCPGLIRTDVWKTMTEQQASDMTKTQLIPRIGEVEEAAEAYLYLMRASYTTGQVLNVDGGMLLGR